MELRKDTRWYDDACGTAHALELVGERWALLVMRELMFGPRRFGELRHDIPRISARVLSARLRELHAKGVVTRRLIASSPPSAEYSLTELGQELLPAIQAITAIGKKLKAGKPRKRAAA